MRDILPPIGTNAFSKSGHDSRNQGKSALPIGRQQKSRSKTGFRENPDFRQCEAGSYLSFDVLKIVPELFDGLLRMITTAPSAVLLGRFATLPLLILLALGISCSIAKIKWKERWEIGDIWNLLPLFVVWISITFSFSVFWERPKYEYVLNFAVVAYVLFGLLAVCATRRRVVTAIGCQSFIGIYAIGQYFLCSMAITGSWL